MDHSPFVVEIPVSPELEARFHELANVWRTETHYLSSSTEMTAHPAYQQIIALGPAAIPLLLRELEREPDWWFTALRALTGANPVPPEACGKLMAMTDAWLAWARQNGIRW
jgi:hypothetical protein